MAVYKLEQAQQSLSLAFWENTEIGIFQHLNNKGSLEKCEALAKIL